MTDKRTRAYSLLDIKDASDSTHVMRGIATSPRPDRLNDVIEMDGVTVASDIPMFLYHDSTKVVGRAKFGKATKNGIPFEATLPLVTESGALRDRIEEAWQMVRHRLITGVSIGFRVIDDAYEIMKNGGIRYLETEVLELSLVPVPAQIDAVIQSVKAADPAAREALIQQIKSADQPFLRAALGENAGRKVVRLNTPPGVSGIQKSTVPLSERKKGAVYL